MPELPEVETTIRGLRPALEGRVLVRVEMRRPDLRRPVPVDLRQRLTGARVTQLWRRAKYGVIDTDRGDSLIFHLGMSGRWMIDQADVKHNHFVLETDAGTVLALNDARRFGSLDLMDSSAVAGWSSFAALGPEPLGEGLNPAYLAGALAGRTGPIKTLLLDQRIIAGLGNIYVCEALHMAKIAPVRSGASLKPKEISRLIDNIRIVLEAAIAAGGSTLRDYAQPGGELGYFAHQWRVYGREGEACGCGRPVERRVDGGRSTFWCSACQK